jgi:amino acid adenylation domain-containing protein
MAEFLLAQAPDFPRLEWLATDTVESAVAGWQPPPIDGDTVAFLQYTSGSTAAPKGVMLTHANLLHNSALIHQCFGHSPQSQGVIWLPPYHDMGLIGGIIQPLYGGFPVTLLSPIDFLKRPLRWLQAISRYGATTSGGPNFAYDLCVRKVGPQERATLELSSWDLAFNGAEPVRVETMARFVEAFAGCGFRREAFYPCYGLAEGTLIASGGHKAAPPVVESVDGLALGQNRIASVAAAHADAQALVGCGHSLEGQQIVIADPETLHRCPPDRIGEVWVGGPSVARGYWGQPEETEETFQAHLVDGEGPFLRTGDLGFLREGELFITGRIKDLIIIRGRNHYPQDIEQTVEASHPVLRPGCGAAFSVQVAGEERLVVAQEVRRESADLDTEGIIHTIRQAVAERHELQVHSVVLLRPRCIPKTSSGKIQRHACRAGFVAGTLEVVTASVLEAAAPGAASGQPEESFIRKALAAVDEEAARQALLTLHLQEQIGRVLRISPSQVDVRHSIAALGLDSLMVIELQHSIETSLGVTVPMASLFQDGSIAQLASDLSARCTAVATTLETALVPVSLSSDEHPLSYGQRALWFLYRLAPDSAAYNLASAVRIQSELDVPALRRAFQALVDRHPALRTTFAVSHGEPVQRIQEHVQVHFCEEDACTWSAAQLNERLIEDAHRPFDLEQGPLLRVHLFRRPAGEYVLLLTIHHIVADLWSLAILAHTLGQFYAAEKSATSLSLAPLALQYTDYVRWQTEMLQGPQGERLWRYWQQQLAGELPILNLPTDHPRLPIQTYRGASESLKLDVALTQRLKALGQAHGATLYMTLLAAFQVLLYRYTGQEDLVVGSPTAGRSQVELADLVGYFVNPVALRADLAGNPTFSVFLQQVRKTVLSAFEHQAFPLAQLVERLQPTRDASRPPLFQVMFALQKAPPLVGGGLAALALGEAGVQMSLGGLELTSVALEQRVAQFDLMLAIAEVDDGLVASFQYNSDLFEMETVARMAGHFQVLLDSIVTAPNQRISDLTLLTTDERHQMLTEWNNTRAEYPQNQCVHELFAAQVARTPNATAVVAGELGLSYKELDERANQLAHYLQKLRVGPEVPVGIYVECSPEMLVGVLAVLKAGGAYLPLNLSHPKQRLAFTLKDARVPVLLTRQQLLENLPDRAAETNLEPDLEVVCLDTDWAMVAQESKTAPVSAAAVENLAYVIYTSGSTGRPKGTLVSHRGVVNYLTWCQSAYPIEAGKGVPVHSPLSFDLTVTALFAPLVTGRAVHLLPDKAAAEALIGALRSETNFSFVKITPAHLELLSQQLSPPQIAGRTHALIIGGENLLSEQIVFWQDFAPDTVLINEYGPTETVVGCCVYQVPPEERRQGSVPIGCPIINTQIYLLDAHLQLVPIGVPGELYVGGVGLANGYLNQPGLTAEKFIPNPFGQEPGARLYRTGDLARYLPDGNIEFLGRMDDQVKIRGFRIELQEIEKVLSQHPTVQEAIVLAREDVSDNGKASLRNKRLVVYVVLSDERASAVNELRLFLKEKLPEYMVPSIFVTLERFPLTHNGKVDRQALPVPGATRPDLGQSFVAPRTLLERALAEMWASALELKQVGVHDNFFELGGHSLLATRLLNRIYEQFQVELPLSTLFTDPTIARLAAIIDQAKPQSTQEKTARQPSMRIPARSRGKGNLDQFVTKLDQLSNLEIKRMLANKRRSEHE